MSSTMTERKIWHILVGHFPRDYTHRDIHDPSNTQEDILCSHLLQSNDAISFGPDYNYCGVLQCDVQLFIHRTLCQYGMSAIPIS